MPLLIAALVVILQIVTGSLLILLTPSAHKRSGYEVLGLGLALGSFLFLLSASLFVNTTLTSIGWLLPSLLVLVGAVIRMKLIFHRTREIVWPRRESLAVALGLVLGFALAIINWIRVPLDVIRAGGSVDMYFFEALSRGISQFGPENSILMNGGQLRYHWFSYGWAGDLTSIAGLESFVSLTRVLPVVAIIGVVFLSASWARKIDIGSFKSPWWVPSLAVVLVVFAGYSGALYGTILNFDSPSQSFATIWLLALAMVFLQGLRVTSRSLVLLSGFLVAGLAAATTGGKASHAIVALGGFGAVTIIGVLLRATWWRNAIVLFAFALIGFLITYFWVLAGVGIDENLAESILVRASTWQQLDPIAGRWGPVLGTLALLLAVVARLSGVGWLAKERKTRESPEFIFSLGAIATGAAALVALRGGINDLWFFLALSAPVSVISAFGVGQALTWLRPNIRHGLRSAILVAAAASVLSLFLSLNWQFEEPPSEFFLWPGVLYWLSVIGPWVVVFVLSWLIIRLRSNSQRGTRTAAVISLAVSALVFTSIFTRPAVLWTQGRELVTEIGTVTPGTESESPNGSTDEVSNPDPLLTNQIQAAQWLNANGSQSQIVATSNPGSSFIPAFTGNQMFLAGERYQRGLGSTKEEAEIDRRSMLSLSLRSAQELLSAQKLCSEGVSFAWIEHPQPGMELPGTTRHDFGYVTIFDLTEYCP